MIKAILLDLDGVIADSEKMRTQYVQKVMRRTFRISIPDRFFDNLFGVKDSEIIERIFARYRIIAPIDEIIVNKKKDLVPMYKNVRMFPGAEVFLKNASKKYKLAVCSSSWRAYVHVFLKSHGIERHFKAVLGREDVTKRKPHPEIYLKAAKKLNVKPPECVVIEDSVVGVEAAKRAGMRCIAVLNSYPLSKLRKADLIVKGLQEREKILSYVCSL